MKKAKIICFSGIDGSGKTTISKFFVKILHENNKKACYVYGRIVPLFTRIGMYIGRKFFLKRSEDELFENYHEYEKHKKLFLRDNTLFRVLFKYTFLFEQLIQIYTKVVPKILYCDYIVLDRYVYDTIITDISPHLEMSIEETLALVQKYSKLVPKPDILILIDVPEEIAYKRKNDVPHIEYLKQRRELYLKIFRSLKKDKKIGTSIYLIDGTKKIEDILSELQLKIIRSVK